MAELRHIEIPETVKLLGQVQYPFVACIEYLIGSDHRFNDSGAGIRAGVEIKAELKGKKPRDRFALDEPNWKLLHEVMEEPHDAQGKKTGKWGVFSQTGTDKDGREVVIGEYLVSGGEFITYLDAVSDKGTQAAAEKMKAEAKDAAKAKNKAKASRKAFGKPSGKPEAKRTKLPDAIKNTANGRAATG